jgi:hypothetical protein
LYSVGKDSVQTKDAAKDTAEAAIVFLMACLPCNLPISMADAVPAAMMPAEMKGTVMDQFR